MRLQLHQEAVGKQLSDCSPRAQALFAFYSADRLRICCWACQAAGDVVIAPFFYRNEALFEMLLASEVPDVRVADTAFEELQEIAPNGSEPLSVQARSGVLCLLTGFDILAKGGRTNITDVVKATIDALDNYQCFVQRRILNETFSPGDYPLLSREMNRQLADAYFVKHNERLEELSVRRVENLQFVIPPAI